MLNVDVLASAVGSSRSAVGLYALSIYDFLLVLDDEYRLVYKAPWNSIKILYLLCRFLPIATWPAMMAIFITGHDNDCSAWVHSQSTICLFLQLSPQCLLLLRAWVFGGKKKLLGWLFSIMISAYLAALIWGAATYMMIYTKQNLQSQEECFDSLSNARHLVGYIIYGVVGIDVAATVIVVYRYMSDQDTQGHLGRIFFSQAVIYVILMVLINACTAFSDIFEPMTATVSYSMTLMMPNLLACRFVLDLRSETNLTATQISERLSVIVRDGLEDA